MFTALVKEKKLIFTSAPGDYLCMESSQKENLRNVDLSLLGRYSELLLSSQHGTHSRRKRKNNAITSRQGFLVLSIRISEDRMGNTMCKGRRRAEKQPTALPGAAHGCRAFSHTLCEHIE